MKQSDLSTDFFDTFDRLYVINLKSRLDRKREVAEQLARLNITFDHPKVVLFEAVRPDDKGEFPTIGTRGCFLSHLGVLKHAHATGCERILILEDDADLCADFEDVFPAVSKSQNDTAWSVFYGYHQEPPSDGAHPIGGRLDLIPPHASIKTTHFIAFRKQAIAALIPYLEAMLTRPLGDDAGGPMHVDGAYNWFRHAHGDMTTLASAKPLAVQRPSRTDIHDLRWYDRIPVVQQLAGYARKKKHALRKP